MSFIGAVIFDLDDTLYPEKEYAFSGFGAVARAFTDRLGDAPRAEGDMRRLFETEHRPRVFNALIAEHGLVNGESLAARMVEVYRSHHPAISLYSDAESALARLRSACKLGLITDGRASAQWAKIDALGLRTRVDEIVVTSELVSVSCRPVEAAPSANAGSTVFAKPHRRAFELMAERLGVAADRCCYVADNAGKDFIAPNSLGWMTVQIRRRDGLYRDALAMPGGNPKYSINTLDALDPLLI